MSSFSALILFYSSILLSHKVIQTVFFPRLCLDLEKLEEKKKL